MQTLPGPSSRYPGLVNPCLETEFSCECACEIIVALFLCLSYQVVCLHMVLILNDCGLLKN